MSIILSSVNKRSLVLQYSTYFLIQSVVQSPFSQTQNFSDASSVLSISPFDQTLTSLGSASPVVSDLWLHAASARMHRVMTIVFFILQFFFKNNMLIGISSSGYHSKRVFYYLFNTTKDFPGTKPIGRIQIFVIKPSFSQTCNAASKSPCTRTTTFSLILPWKSVLAMTKLPLLLIASNFPVI